MNCMFNWCSTHSVFVVLRRQFETRAPPSRSGGCGFEPQSGHTEYFENGSSGFPSLALRVVGLALQTTLWCQNKWTSKTGNLPRNRCDIT